MPERGAPGGETGTLEEATREGSNLKDTQQETGFQHLSRIYRAIEQAALSSPWAKDPYVVMRREKAKGKSNALPTRRAQVILQRHDAEFNELACRLERESDGLWLRERKCTSCGLTYEPLPDGDTGLCILCIMEVKKA